MSIDDEALRRRYLLRKPSLEAYSDAGKNWAAARGKRPPVRRLGESAMGVCRPD